MTSALFCVSLNMVSLACPKEGDVSTDRNKELEGPPGTLSLVFSIRRQSFTLGIPKIAISNPHTQLQGIVSQHQE